MPRTSAPVRHNRTCHRNRHRHHHHHLCDFAIYAKYSYFFPPPFPPTLLFLLLLLLLLLMANPSLGDTRSTLHSVPTVATPGSVLVPEPASNLPSRTGASAMAQFSL